MSNKINYVKDIHGNTLFLDEELVGKGGQGFVFRTKDNNIAIKLLAKNGEIIEDVELAKKYSEIIEEAIVLDLPNNINVCRPETILEPPYCGYTMRLLDSNTLVSLKDAIAPNDYKELNSQFPLKKRVELLIELSRTLSVLHSRGFVYCDLSPNNILFASKTEGLSKVWLIDCDNLRKTSDVRTSIFTPDYGAPEIVKGLKHNNIYSDIYSFAIIAFKVLTGLHPLFVNYNDGTSSGGWDSTTAATETDAQVVDSIYIGDTEFEKYNEVVERLSLCTNKKLVTMFSKVFSSKEDNDETKRPLMNEWYEALVSLYTHIGVCEHCGASVLVGSKTCSVCESAIRTKPTEYLVVKQCYSGSYIDEVIELIKNDEEYTLYKNDDGEIPNEDELKASLWRSSIKDLFNIVLYDGKIIYSFELKKESIEDVPAPMIRIESAKDESLIIRIIGDLKLCDASENPIGDFRISKGKSAGCYVAGDFKAKTTLIRLNFVNQ